MVNQQGIIMGTLDLNVVVGLYVLIIPLFALNWPWDQSLGVYLLMSMAAPNYGSSLEEIIKRLCMCFTNCDYQTDEITICLNIYSLEKLVITSLAHFTCISLPIVFTSNNLPHSSI